MSYSIEVEKNTTFINFKQFCLDGVYKVYTLQNKMRYIFMIK